MVEDRASVRPETRHVSGEAAIVIVCRDAVAREAFGRELSGRYGVDYRIVDV